MSTSASSPAASSLTLADRDLNAAGDERTR